LLSGRDPSSFSSRRSANFSTADSSSQINSIEFIINISYRVHRQDLHRFTVKNRQIRPNRRIVGRSIKHKDVIS
jgi:hypothetical protein